MTHVGYSAQYPCLGHVQQATSVCIDDPALTSQTGTCGRNDLSGFFVFIPHHHSSLCETWMIRGEAAKGARKEKVMASGRKPEGTGSRLGAS